MIFDLCYNILTKCRCSAEAQNQQACLHIDVSERRGTVYYFSFPYFFYILVAAAVVVGLYYLFKDKSDFAKKILVFSIMMVNLLQHLLKSYIYPHMWGQGFTGVNTAYNMCAFLIIATPFVFMFGSELWKNFIVSILILV